jgi:hypothetical protein
MKTILQIISILACLSLVSLGARAQENNEEGTPATYQTSPLADSSASLHAKHDTAWKLNIRVYRDCYPQYIIDGTKVNKEGWKVDSIKIERQALAAFFTDNYFTPAKNEESVVTQERHFNTTYRASYTRWECKEFGILTYPNNRL